MLYGRLLLVLALSVLGTAGAPTDSQEVQFALTVPGEAWAEITASAPGASWNCPAAEAAVATLYLDDRYNQDMVLFQGEQRWAYRVFLGPLEPGTHRLRVERNPRWSAVDASLQVQEVRVHTLAATDPDYPALAHAPILYARADTLGYFSDVPLLLYYERFPDAGGETLQYSLIFSNEDAGTPTDALMARWGRATDIEYAYRVRFDVAGNIVQETFQGREHKEFAFAGGKEGRHPFLLVATQNNMFADTGFSAVQYRLLPVTADLGQASREELMDRFPWIYRIMAQELGREGKLRPFAAVAGTAIGDPRNYLYLELNAENRDAGVVAWVKLKGEPRWLSSHSGRREFAIGRSGWLRTTVELPPGTTADSIEYVALECVDLREARNREPTIQPESLVRGIRKAFILDADYAPGPNVLVDKAEVSLRPGEMYTFIPRPP
ncbi:MAG: hypothetical protein HY653_01450 [Acidobacteria bacterium]|nr:hypothetical protein [Acidobacteriota bacterium]